MTFSPPCLTVGIVFFGRYSVFLLLQTCRVGLMPDSMILVYFDHSTFSQVFSASFRCSLATRWALTFALLSTGTLVVLQDINALQHSVL